MSETTLTPAERKAARQRASRAAGISRGAKKRARIETLPDAPAEENLQGAEESACLAETTEVNSVTSETAPGLAPDSAPETAQAGSRMMTTFTLKGQNKRGTQAIFIGTTDGENGGRVKTAIRVPLAAFVDKQAPQTWIAEAPFAVRGKARSEMTPEERKAARAARPKLTLAEKAKKAEERAARLREQLEKQAAAEPAAASM